MAEHAYDAATGELKVEPNGSPRASEIAKVPGVPSIDGVLPS